MCLREGLDASKKGQNSCPIRNQIPDCPVSGLVARTTMLLRILSSWVRRRN